MGAIADAFAAYAQPLLDQTDGSEEQLNKAFTISQLCYNLALMQEDCVMCAMPLSRLRLYPRLSGQLFGGAEGKVNHA